MITSEDLSVFARDLGLDTKAFIAAAIQQGIAPLLAKNVELERKAADLEARLIDIERREPITGLVGPPGLDGKDGAPGRDGKDGAIGPKGADGVNGLDGKVGAPGLNGKDGRDGIDGKDGLPGLNGKDGADGLLGSAGPIGAPGRDGRDGKDGAPGLNGRDGVSGLDGKDGAPGLNGKDGTNGIDGKDGAPGLNGKDGADGLHGKDGFGFDDLDVVFDQEHGYALRFIKGADSKDIPVPFPFDAGTYVTGRLYPKAAGVTDRGAYWIAQEQTKARPPKLGEPRLQSCPWRLAVKPGRDGKDAEPKKDEE